MRGILSGLVAMLLANAAALFAADYLLDGMTLSPAGDDIWKPLLLAALILGVLNAIVRPILSLMALPVILLTFGLAYVLVNVLILWMLSGVLTFLEPSFGLAFAGFGTLLIASVIIGVVNNIIHWLLRD